jgi:hypothetical protein
MVVAPHLLHPVTSSPPAADLRKRGDQAQLAGAPPLEKIRDVTYSEDASQIRTANGPRVMATLRNLVIAIMKMAGTANIAATCRHHARDAARTLTTLGLTPP